MREDRIAHVYRTHREYRESGPPTHAPKHVEVIGPYEAKTLMKMKRKMRRFIDERQNGMDSLPHHLPS
jgi:hypothetical protein